MMTDKQLAFPMLPQLFEERQSSQEWVESYRGGFGCEKLRRSGDSKTHQPAFCRLSQRLD